MIHTQSDPAHSATPGISSSRLGAIAQRKLLRLSIPPESSNQSKPPVAHSKATHPNNPDSLRPNLNRAKSSVPVPSGLESQNGTRGEETTLIVRQHLQRRTQIPVPTATDTLHTSVASHVSHTHTHTHSLSLSLTHTYTLSHTHTHIHSLYLTHTLMSQHI